MAQVLAVSDILQISLVTFDTDQVGLNVVHARVTAVGGTPATDLDVATQLDNALAPIYKAVLNNNAQWRGVLAQRIRPLPITIPQVAHNFIGVGTAGAIALPRQSCGLLSYRTVLGGRANRGRSYIPFPASADDQGDGHPTAGYLTRIQAIFTTLGGNLQSIVQGGRTATLFLGIYHRSNQTITDVADYTANANWATQRRRGSYGRLNTPPV